MKKIIIIILTSTLSISAFALNINKNGYKQLNWYSYPINVADHYNITAMKVDDNLFDKGISEFESQNKKKQFLFYYMQLYMVRVYSNKPLKNIVNDLSKVYGKGHYTKRPDGTALSYTISVNDNMDIEAQKIDNNTVKITYKNPEMISKIISQIGW